MKTKESVATESTESTRNTLDSVKLKLQLEPLGGDKKQLEPLGDDKKQDPVESNIPMTVRGCSSKNDPPLSNEKREALMAAVNDTTKSEKALKKDGRQKNAEPKMAAKKAKAKSKTAKKKADEESNTLDSEEEPSSEQLEESSDEDDSQKQAAKARLFVLLFWLARSHHRFSLSLCHLLKMMKVWCCL